MYVITELVVSVMSLSAITGCIFKEITFQGRYEVKLHIYGQTLLTIEVLKSHGVSR